MLTLPDTYTLQARVAPGLIAGVPPLTLLAGGLLAPSLTAKLASAVLGVVLFVMPQLVRDAGLRVQRQLWHEWGGSPTRRRLRYRDASSMDEIRERHAALEGVTGVPLPGSAKQEALDAESSDVAYDRAETRLRDLTRDHERFGLLFDENKNYGMRRNMLGIRRWALAAAAATFLACATGILLSGAPVAERLKAWGSPAAVSLSMALLWWRVVTPQWVKQAAELYADRLFAALDVLAAEAESSAP